MLSAFTNEQACTQDTAARGQAFSAYINWETDQRAKSLKHATKAPTSDPNLIHAVFERAVALYAQAAADADRTAMAIEEQLEQMRRDIPDKKKKGKMKQKDPETNIAMSGMESERQSAMQTAFAYKELEGDIWKRYIAWMVSGRRYRC
jgi:hypothetical protein